MSSITQSTDYKRKGVEDICKIKRKSGRESGREEVKGRLTKSIMRKIFDIISNTDNVKSVVPDLAYLAARNAELNPETELGHFIIGLLDMINKGTKKEDLVKYLEGAVMAVYVIEEAKNIDPYELLNCKGE